jgi:hypothetical protein
MPFSLQPSLAAALAVMLPYVRGDRDVRSPRSSNRLGFDMGLVAIICPVCVHVGFARAEQLPRVLTCSRCHHKQNFSRPTPRQRPTEGN